MKKHLLTVGVALMVLGSHAQTTTFNFTGTVQTYTVPVGVTQITIDARGAQGGGSFNGAGGMGARMNGTYAVTPGQVLTIIVGEQGHLQVGGNAQNSSGGGGGSFVYDASGPTLLVAAGGGGGKCNWTSSQPLHPAAAGQITTSGGASSDGNPGGTGGNGGNAGLWSSVPCAGGGCGWLSNGGGPYGGFNAAGSWAGGTGYCGGGGGGCGGIGGYGGGGGGGNHYGGGGGGGGYSGGGGGTDPTHGGGGGSYSIGTSQLNTAGFQTGNGQVIITELNPCAGDVTPPVLSGCPSSSTTPNTTGTCGAVVTFSTPTATDNCSSATVTQTSGLASGSTFPVGNTVNTFTATDAMGNSSTCSFTVTITDTETPVPVVPVLPALTDQCSVTLTAPTANDNCGTIIATTPDPTTYSADGTFTVNWTYTDGGGNTATQTQTVTIDDVTAPVISGCPANITLAANSSNCTGVTTWNAPTVTDNCTASPTVTASHSPSFAFPLGTTTVTYTFDDGRGNVSTCSFDVTVTGPTVSLTIANDTVCLADGAFTLTGESPAGGLYTGPGVNAGTFSPSAAGTGTHLITYSYTDANGCGGTVMDSIYVDVCLAASSAISNSQFSVVPNPNNGTFTLQLNSNSVADVLIYDAQGKLIVTQKVNNSNQQIILAESGMYLITVVTADGQTTSQRVIVQ